MYRITTGCRGRSAARPRAERRRMCRAVRGPGMLASRRTGQEAVLTQLGIARTCNAVGVPFIELLST